MEKEEERLGRKKKKRTGELEGEPNSSEQTSCLFTGKSMRNDVNCQKGRSCQ